jgi:hypothetical protein
MSEKLWAGGIVSDKREDGLYVLVIDHENLDPRYARTKITRLFGGTQNDDEESDALIVFDREMLEEVGIKRKDGVLPDLICTVPPRDRRTLKRVFYQISFSDCVGELRRGYKFDGRQKLGEPRWVKADDLFKPSSLFHGHVDPLKKFLRQKSLAV